MAGWRVWDAMRAIDYLSTRPEVDAKRIATLGASGGGTTSLLTGALDERVKVAVVSAYFNTLPRQHREHLALSGQLCAGAASGHGDVRHRGARGAARLFVESGRNDRIFPIAGS